MVQSSYLSIVYKIMKNFFIAFVVGGAGFLIAAQNSSAGSLDAGDLNYHVALVGSCTASVTNGTISLGSQFAYDGNILNAGAGNILVTCTNGMSYKLCVNGGNAPTSSHRRLEHTTSAGNFLEYDLNYLGTVLGDKDCLAAGALTETAAWANPINAVGIGGLQTYTLTADVFVPVDSIPGTYKDAAVAVTVLW
ncbi:MAG: hypothetical protein D3915_12495 [Candidatus Electrothrix sp. AU1_5]|nr:hypothetical protein [Candidatus Electrothrix gigas]